MGADLSLDPRQNENRDRPACRDCKYLGFTRSSVHQFAVCRRYPPTYDPGPAAGCWPTVVAGDWCGEFVHFTEGFKRPC